nr:hypothetical protein [Bacilli bacterium]
MIYTLFLLLPLLAVWLGWRVVARFDPYVGDTFYRVKLAYRKSTEKSVLKRIKTLVYNYIEAVIPKDWLVPLERILTSAGRPGGLNAIDVILMQLLIVAGMGILDMWATKSSPIFLLILTIAVVTMPWRRWLGQIQTRRLNAAEQIRGLKRRYVSLLQQGTPFEESLRIISREAQGDFGEVFRRRLKEGRMRGLSESLLDLQHEFRVAELTNFIQVVRVADRNSTAALVELVGAQVKDETSKMQDFVDKRKAVTENRMRMYTAGAFVYMLVFAGYFVYRIAMAYFSVHSIFGL